VRGGGRKGRGGGVGLFWEVVVVGGRVSRWLFLCWVLLSLLVLWSMGLGVLVFGGVAGGWV